MKRKLSRKETVDAIKIVQSRRSSSAKKNINLSKLMKDYKGLVLRHATYYYKLRRDVTDRGDLIGAGWQGFYKALMQYDISKADEVQFVTYANNGIQMAVLGAYRKQVDI